MFYFILLIVPFHCLRGAKVRFFSAIHNLLIYFFQSEMNTHTKYKQRGFEYLVIKALVGNYGFIMCRIVIDVVFNRLYAIAASQRGPPQVVVVQPKAQPLPFYATAYLEGYR